MTTLKEFQDAIDALRKKKKWNNDQVWLAHGVFKEMGELVSAVEHNLSDKEKGKEYADIMHFLFQYMRKTCPNIDLEKALWQKIHENSNTKKKTYVKGKIVRR